MADTDPDTEMPDLTDSANNHVLAMGQRGQECADGEEATTPQGDGKTASEIHGANAAIVGWRRRTEKPSELRKIVDPQLQYVEVPEEVYGDIFDQLQLKSSQWHRFFVHVVRKYRQKHLPDLARATPASIKSLSKSFLRAFGYKIWTERFEDEWLRELKEGETRLYHDRKGENERFYPILEQLWQKMHDTIFEDRPTALKRGPKRLTLSRDDNLNRGDTVFAAADMQKSVHQHIANMRSELQAPSQNADDSNSLHQYLSPEATSTAIDELVVRLSQIRSQSHPEVFQQAWDEQIMRLEDFEEIPQGQTDEETENERNTQDNRALQTSAVSWLPHSLPTNIYPLQTSIGASEREPPTSMTVYISTWPVTDPAYARRSYIWYSAPTSVSSRYEFFTGLDARVSVEGIRGWVMSYGWDDLCRWIENDGDGAAMRTGWEIFQNDLRRAAVAVAAAAAERKQGKVKRNTEVGGWRMKVLVIGKK